MSDPTCFALFLSATAAIVVAPGPDTFYVLGRSLEQGRIAGTVSALGVFVGNLGHTLAATVGLSAILMTSALAFNVVKYVGAVYLIYLGVRTLLSRNPNALAPTVTQSGLAKIFGQAVLTNLLNPKAALFFLAFIPQFINPAAGQIGLQTFQLGIIVAAMSSLWLTLMSGFVGSLRPLLNRNNRFMAFQRWIMGSLLVGLGLRLAVADAGDR